MNICAQCKFCGDGWIWIAPDFWTCGHPENREPIDPVSGYQGHKLCREVNTDGSCKLWEKEEVAPLPPPPPAKKRDTAGFYEDSLFPSIMRLYRRLHGR